MDMLTLLTQKLYCPMSAKVAQTVIEECKKVYLNGIPAWTYYENDTFPRLGGYIGHGVCYEASALLMLALKNHCNARLVFGMANSKNGKSDHCWVEIKDHGVWWVIDPTWITMGIPIPRHVYKPFMRASTVRAISHREFFSCKLAQDFANLIERPETSYIFSHLSAFRKATWETGNQMFWEIYGSKCFESSNGKWDPRYVIIFKQPVTPKILRELVVKEQRIAPKKRTIRRARNISKKVNRLLAETADSIPAPS